MMQVLSESQIEDLCEQFDTVWCADSAGLNGILSFLRERDFHCPVDQQTAVNLIEIDLERIWMAWDKKLDRIGLHADAAGLVRALRLIPSFSSYEGLFHDCAEFERSKLDLAVCESICRDQWGDAIGNHYYHEIYDLMIPPNSSVEPRVLRCDFEGHRQKTSPIFPLRGQNLIGRQRSYDASECFFEETSSGNRIVVAGFSDATISRDQFAIQVLSRSLAVVNNRSEINSLRVASYAELGLNQSIVVRYPFSIRLPGRKLYCY